MSATAQSLLDSYRSLVSDQLVKQAQLGVFDSSVFQDPMFEQNFVDNLESGASNPLGLIEPTYQPGDGFLPPMAQPFTPVPPTDVSGLIDPMPAVDMKDPFNPDTYVDPNVFPSSETGQPIFVGGGPMEHPTGNSTLADFGVERDGEGGYRPLSDDGIDWDWNRVSPYARWAGGGALGGGVLGTLFGGGKGALLGALLGGGGGALLKYLLDKYGS
jgi:hypothetical protein